MKSRFKQNAVSQTGAKTMFQFFDPAAKSVGTTVADMLKSDALTIEKGTQYFANMLKQSGGDVIQAIARYHDGTTAISKRMAEKGGKFDLSMVKLTRVGEKFGNRDVQQVNDWNNTVYPLMNFINENKIKVFHESKYYRVSEFCVEGERGYISGTQSSNISSENNGLEYYKLI